MSRVGSVPPRIIPLAALALPVFFAALTLTGTARGKILTGPAMDSHNTFDRPDTVHPVPYLGNKGKGGEASFHLPARSIAVVAVE